MKLFVFATTRKVREFYENKLTQNALLDKAMAVADFFDIILYHQKPKASEYERLLIMKKACERTKNANKLFIPQEFFAFLKNNEYLFSFFKELALAQKDILALQENDYYAQYNEHLHILDELLKNYLYALNEANLCDEISLCRDYEINGDFLSQFDELHFDLQGFLNAFEMNVLKKITQFTKVILHFHTSSFNLTHLKSLPIFKDLKLQNKHIYALNLNDKIILSEEKFEFSNKKAKVKKFEQRSVQAAFVFDRISHFMRLGISPDDIVVITPDESFCALLKIFDKNNMLNFASGKAINETTFYHKLKAFYEAGKKDNFNFDVSTEYLTQSPRLNLENCTLSCLEISNFQAFQKEFHQKVSFKHFSSFINALLETESMELKNAINEEFFFIKALLNTHQLTLKEILELFFQRIQRIKQSDVSGGAVRVMGILESRALCYKGVIIVDFNDEFVPQRSVNELFLNNEVRKRAGLFSYEMRENLQRFYYESLIKNAKEVAISYLENEQSSKSRFLQELQLLCEEENKLSMKAYRKALRLDFVPNSIDLTPLSPPIEYYNIFEKPLSYSRLSTFIEYKHTYYYQYCKQINAPRELYATNEKQEFGTVLHELLGLYYKPNAKHFDYEDFVRLLDEDFRLSRLDKAILKLRFKEFAIFEKEHFSKGFKVLSCEKNLKAVPYKVDDKEILLTGRIDRIDEKAKANENEKEKEKEKANELLIIDYKTGKIPENSYQLAFYQALLGEKCEAVFYDLTLMKKIAIKQTKNLDKLNDLFRKLLDEVGKIEFKNEKAQYTYDEHSHRRLIYDYALIYEKKDLR